MCLHDYLQAIPWTLLVTGSYRLFLSDISLCNVENFVGQSKLKPLPCLTFTLLSQIKEYNQENVPIVELIDSSQNDRNIGEELINQEFAIRAEN